MPTVNYISPDDAIHSIDVPVGMTLMHGATLNNVPGLLAECGGAMICATCHCYVEPEWLNRLELAGHGERDKLKHVHQPKSNSRLSCQIKMTEQLDGITVRFPPSQVWTR